MSLKQLIVDGYFHVPKTDGTHLLKNISDNDIATLAKDKRVVVSDGLGTAFLLVLNPELNIFKLPYQNAGRIKV